MLVGCTLNSTSGRGRVVNVHAHTRLLRSLTGKDIHGGRLRDLGSSVNNLLAALVDGLDFDDHVAVAHASVRELDTQFIARKGHAYKVNVVSVKQEGEVNGQSQKE